MAVLYLIFFKLVASTLVAADAVLAHCIYGGREGTHGQRAKVSPSLALRRYFHIFLLVLGGGRGTLIINRSSLSDVFAKHFL